MPEPFLFRFKQECQSPNRNGAKLDIDYVYDISADMVIDMGTAPPVPAIKSHRKGGPKTKKKDIEKGEDMKDRRMWQ